MRHHHHPPGHSHVIDPTIHCPNLKKVRDVGLVEFADMLGIKDPGELLRVAELRQRAAKYVLFCVS